jgi:hypothetical protein
MEAGFREVVRRTAVKYMLYQSVSVDSRETRGRDVRVKINERERTRRNQHVDYVGNYIVLLRFQRQFRIMGRADQDLINDLERQRRE